MKRISAQFLFDFGSPNAYFCHRVLPGIEARTGVTFEYVPILLGGLFKLTNNRSPAIAFADIPNKRAYDKLEINRFVKKHALSDFKPNEHFPVNTMLTMRGAVAAQKLGFFEDYVETVFKCMWEQSLNMAEVDVARGALNNAGLDADAILSATRDDDVKARLMANTQIASNRGAFGSPTFFIGNEIFFGKDRLREVEEEIVRQLADASESK
jgi:2-hydroxychromene-2-carboxylate isomerase